MTGLACRTAAETSEARWHELCSAPEWCDCGCHAAALRRWQIRKREGVWWVFRQQPAYIRFFDSWAEAVEFVRVRELRRAP